MIKSVFLICITILRKEMYIIILVYNISILIKLRRTKLFLCDRKRDLLQSEIMLLNCYSYNNNTFPILMVQHSSINLDQVG